MIKKELNKLSIYIFIFVLILTIILFYKLQLFSSIDFHDVNNVLSACLLFSIPLIPLFISLSMAIVINLNIPEEKKLFLLEIIINILLLIFATVFFLAEYSIAYYFPTPS
mgnify:CR=1 FL=1